MSLRKILDALNFDGCRTGRIDCSKPNYTRGPQSDPSHAKLQYWLKKGAGIPVEYNEEFEKEAENERDR